MGQKIICQLLNSSRKVGNNMKYIETQLNDDNTTVVVQSDSKRKYIIINHGMIYVDDYPAAELERLINEEDYEPAEAYDTIDAADYFNSSKFAEYIIAGLLQTVNKFL